MTTPHADTQEQLHIHKLQMRFSTPAFLILYGSASVSYCQAQQQLFTASSATSYSGLKQACADEGLRLCTLRELCPSRPYEYTSPFNQVFTPDIDYLNIDIASNPHWSAYETTDGDGANCSSPEGGCRGNSWVMIGKYYTGYGSDYTCNTHCEVVRQTGSSNAQCADWGSSGHEMSRNYLCCPDEGTYEVS